MQTDSQLPATPPGSAPCSGSVAAGYWNPYPQDKPEQEGWYLIWHAGGEEGSGYLAGSAMAYYNPRLDDWEDADSNGAIMDGCKVTHWAFVKSPNEKGQP